MNIGQNSPEDIDDVVCFSQGKTAYLNITNQCTLHCSFCPKLNRNWRVHGHCLKLSRQVSASRVLLAMGDPRHYDEVVFSGLGEPTLHLDVLIEVAKVIHGRTRVHLVTDGLGNLVQGMDITPLLAGYIDAISISLNAHQESVYNQLCHPPQTGTYPALLDFIDAARTRLNNVSLTAIEGLKGVDLAACQDIANAFDVKFKARRQGECV